MFRKKAPAASALPEPPTLDSVFEDLSTASPDDIVFTADLTDLDIFKLSENNFKLPQRFKRESELSADTENHINENHSQDPEILYEKVIEYNQNVEKLESLTQKLKTKLQQISQSKGELSDDYKIVKDRYQEALTLHQNLQSMPEH